VHLVTAAEAQPELPRVSITRVETAAEMLEACRALLPRVRLLLMAAAVADFRVERPSDRKIHRGETPELELRLVPSLDVLAQLMAERPPGCVVVGFAAETEEVRKRGLAKLRSKGCDLIVANPVSGEHSAMGGDSAEATLLARDGRVVELSWQRKAQIAAQILDEAQRLAQELPTPPPSR
jgi:phosphopantothenoylcysteine decarboxylase/phosphopantothenate--cysteine ligase